MLSWVRICLAGAAAFYCTLHSLTAHAAETHIESKEFKYVLPPNDQVSNMLGCKSGDLISGGVNLDNKKTTIAIDESYPTKSAGVTYWRAGLINTGTQSVSSTYDIILLCSGSGIGIAKTLSGLLYVSMPTHQFNGRNVYNIFSLTADGAATTQLTYSPADKEYDNSAPAVSPDGTKIVFMTMRHREEVPYGNHSEIYVMDSDGSNEVRLTANRSLDDDDPRWCPDGRIIFSQNGSIIEMDAVDSDGDMNGDNQVAVIQPEDGEEYYSPDCSPDGSRIVLLRKQGLQPDVVIANRDGTNLVPLGGSVSYPTQPRWSPDGMKILLGSMRAQPGSGIYDLYVMEPQDNDGDGDGDNLARITVSTADGGSNFPAWSPDGQHIAFSKHDADGIGARIVDKQGNAETGPLTPIPGEAFVSDWR